MKSLRYAVIVAFGLILLGMLLVLASQGAIARAHPGEELPLPWRLALRATNENMIWAPFLAPLAIGAAALIGWWRSRGLTVAEERRTLFGWLVAEILAGAITFAVLVAGSRAGVPVAAMHAAIVLMGLGLVALVATGVIAVHLQRRVESSGSWLRAWHVAIAMCVAVFLGPFALVPPAVVWWNSRPS